MNLAVIVVAKALRAGCNWLNEDYYGVHKLRRPRTDFRLRVSSMGSSVVIRARTSQVGMRFRERSTALISKCVPVETKTCPSISIRTGTFFSNFTLRIGIGNVLHIKADLTQPFKPGKAASDFIHAYGFDLDGAIAGSENDLLYW